MKLYFVRIVLSKSYFLVKMCSKQNIQEEKQSFELPKPIVTDEILECPICWNEVEREKVDINCSCLRHRLCHRCAYLAFETPGIDIVIDYLN